MHTAAVIVPGDLDQTGAERLDDTIQETLPAEGVVELYEAHDHAAHAAAVAGALFHAGESLRRATNIGDMAASDPSSVVDFDSAMVSHSSREEPESQHHGHEEEAEQGENVYHSLGIDAAVRALLPCTCVQF